MKQNKKREEIIIGQIIHKKKKEKEWNRKDEKLRPIKSYTKNRRQRVKEKKENVKTEIYQILHEKKEEKKEWKRKYQQLRSIK